MCRGMTHDPGARCRRLGRRHSLVRSATGRAGSQHRPRSGGGLLRRHVVRCSADSRRNGAQQAALPEADALLRGYRPGPDFRRVDEGPPGRHRARGIPPPCPGTKNLRPGCGGGHFRSQAVHGKLVRWRGPGTTGAGGTGFAFTRFRARTPARRVPSPVAAPFDKPCRADRESCRPSPRAMPVRTEPRRRVVGRRARS